MPIFEFRCKKCQHVFEEFVFSSNSSVEDISCPTCGENNIEKLMSAFCSAGSNSTSGFAAPSSSCGSGGFS
jgi:putative FmdB family regulatory protein